MWNLNLIIKKRKKENGIWTIGFPTKMEVRYKEADN